ncbi:hypothetical protein AADX40_21635, partial [Aeromonas veronii]|uniref:hypothetical protein n=1 Tax=Aeromonas veronii TaxID=654 RepID=UPI003158B5F7
YRIGNCQSGSWRKQFYGMTFKTVAGLLGNLGGDASFAACEDGEIVLGGGGSCTTAYGYPGGYGTAITSAPRAKGELYFESMPAWGYATKNGWVYDCNGYPGVGGIATAVVACGKP